MAKVTSSNFVYSNSNPPPLNTQIEKPFDILHLPSLSILNTHIISLHTLNPSAPPFFPETNINSYSKSNTNNYNHYSSILTILSNYRIITSRPSHKPKAQSFSTKSISNYDAYQLKIVSQNV